MSTLGKDIGLGCGRAAVIQIIAVLIGLPASLVLLGVSLWLATAFADRPLIIVIGAGGLLTLFFGALLGFVVIVVLRRKSRLDAVFTPLGMQGDVYQTLFRQYHGTVAGRQVDVYVYRGPVLEIEVQTPLKTRLGITQTRHADTRFFAGLANREPLTLDDPAAQDLMVFAEDAAWARALLAQPAIPARLQRMTSQAGSTFTRHQLRCYPGACQLMLTGNRKLFGLDLNATQARAWLDDLLAVVTAAEALPAPEVTSALTGAERLAQRTRALPKYYLIWVALIAGVAIVAIGVVIAVAVLLLM